MNEIKWLIRLYPQSRRQRYEDEIMAMPSKVEGILSADDDGQDALHKYCFELQKTKLPPQHLIYFRK